VACQDGRRPPSYPPREQLVHPPTSFANRPQATRRRRMATRH
jgi:hypothetical protein